MRGELGAGPMRMNRVTVRRATAGLVAHLLATVPDAAERGLAIGYDARHKSDAFALDTAAVAAGMGMKALLLPAPRPTPVLAWSVPHLGAAAGVMVTASHNPPRDNGYKVYLDDGSQIVSPIDVAIAAAIDAVDLAEIEVGRDRPPPDRAPRRRPPSGPTSTPCRGAPRPPVPWTSAWPTPRCTASAERPCWLPSSGPAGRRQPWWRPSSCPIRTSPRCPSRTPRSQGPWTCSWRWPPRSGRTWPWPTTLTPTGSAPPSRRPDGGWRRLTGDELGWLLADHILAHTSGDDRLVVTTLVSSSLLGRMAQAAGVQHAETFTGFKWIARIIRDRPAQRFVFGYEQALGYLVTARPRDKDGITAAVLMAEVAALAKAEGVSLQQRLDDLAGAVRALRHGRALAADGAGGGGGARRRLCGPTHRPRWRDARSTR